MPNALGDWWQNARQDRNWLYRLGDGLIGFDDGVETGGEALGRGINALALGLYRDPVGTVGGAVRATEADLRNLMFEGGAMERPEDVLGYAAAPMAPGIARMGRYDPNTANAFRAYHGSPHDFDKFSMDAIGTGEGAQAYGHGLYFAENEGVARSYRNMRGGTMSAEAKSALRELDNLGFDTPAAAMTAIRQNPDWRQRWDVQPHETQLADVIDQHLSDRPGSMYEVNINADPDDFLDWDAPLSEQSPKVREGLRQFGIDEYAEKTKAMGLDEPSGAAVYESNRITPGQYRDQKTATQNLLYDAGIPGIKYRDAGSRNIDGNETGTRNFVVFDENLIEIVRKYGVAGAATMLGVSAGEVQAAMEQR